MAKTKAVTTPSFWRRNGMSLVFLGLFLVTLIGLAFAGWQHENQERAEHGETPHTLAEYVRQPHFWSAVTENWESEFLQMGLFLLLSVALRQQGSAESRPLDPAEEAADKKKFPAKSQPWPVRSGGLWEKLYGQSLSLALLLLFAISFVAHWLQSWKEHVDEQRMHGESPTPLGEFLWDAEFWFQSLQNWQSEFLAILSLIVLSIWLRQKDSPQSKQVEAPHSHTGH